MVGTRIYIITLNFFRFFVLRYLLSKNGFRGDGRQLGKIRAGAMQDVGCAVDVPHFGAKQITQPRNLSSATSSHQNHISRRLRPVLIIAALVLSLPFLKGIVACGGGQITVEGTDVAGIASNAPGSGLGMPTTVITSQDYTITQRLGGAAPIPNMESGDYQLSNED